MSGEVIGRWIFGLDSFGLAAFRRAWWKFDCKARLGRAWNFRVQVWCLGVAVDVDWSRKIPRPLTYAVPPVLQVLLEMYASETGVPSQENEKPWITNVPNVKE